MPDSLGDRMKRYENVTRYYLPPKQGVIVRIDGRAFHTYTRGADKPFDKFLMDGMAYATEMTAKEMSGFKLAYTQSDEASFLITDMDDFASQGWFDYNLNKVVSISASTFTAHFNRFAALAHPTSTKVATFDSRAFPMPMDDVPNYFVWRQKDWFRNSLSMLAQAHFSPKQLDGMKAKDMHNMLHEKDINWADLDARQKNGTFIYRELGLGGPVGSVRTFWKMSHAKADYIQINDWVTGQRDKESLYV